MAASVSHESYFGARVNAFRRKALVKRIPLQRVDAGTPLTKGQQAGAGPADSDAAINGAEAGAGGAAGENAGGDMKRVLGAWDLMMFGVGGIVGAGVFVLTGVGAHDVAGPAIIVSYLIASFAAALSAICYTEFAVDMPVAGGAFNYVALVCGELLGWIAGWNLVLETTLSVAAVGRGFTSYTSTLFGMDPNSWRIPAGPLQIDLPGFAMICVMTALLCYGTKESAQVNAIVTAINVLVILFVIGAGMIKIEPGDYEPFAPKGITGVFNGAAIVFFS